MKLLPAHRLARLNYAPRTLSFAFAFLVIGLLYVERQFSAWVLLFAALQFIAFPHLAFLHARLAANSKKAELNNLLVDAVLLGAWAAQLGFALWPTCGLLAATSLNSAVSGGLRRLGTNLAGFAAGAAVWGAITGFPLRPETGMLVSVVCMAGLAAYVGWVGMIMYRQNQRLRATREALRSSEEQFRFITEHAGDLVAMLDADGRWLYNSPSFAQHFDDIHLRLGGDAFLLVHRDDRDAARAAFRRMMETGEGELLRLRFVDRFGQPRIVECDNNPVSDAPGRITRLIMVGHDLTAGLKAEIDLRLAAHAFDSLVDGVLISQADGRIDYINKAYSGITGFDPGDMVGYSTNDFKSGLQPEHFYREIWVSVAETGTWQGRMWQRRKNGTVFPAWVSVGAVKDGTGAVTHYVWIVREVTDDYRARTAS